MSSAPPCLDGRVCCSVLQYVAVCCSGEICVGYNGGGGGTCHQPFSVETMLCVAMRSVVQRVVESCLASGLTQRDMCIDVYIYIYIYKERDSLSDTTCETRCET